MGAPVWNGTRWVGGWESGYDQAALPYGHDQSGPEPVFGNDFAGQIARRQQGPSTPSGTTIGGQYWDPAQGKWVASTTGEGTPGASGGATGGGTTGGTNTPFGTIQTSIQPRSQVYSPLQTQMAVNQAVSDSRISPGSAYKQFDRPGLSRSQSTKYRAAPAIAAGFSQGAQQAAGIPLGDEIANQQNLMQGQLAQHQEFTGLANLLLKQLGLQQSTGQANLGNLSALMQMLGGYI